MFDSVVRNLGSFSREFTRRGKQIFLVGGAVRNLLLGRPAHDYDFTTDATPAEVSSFFRKVLPTGLQHGTVTVVFQGSTYEVTTFRVDGQYTDGRHPSEVTFTPSLEEDLKRRDFTINAMALDLSDGKLVDPHDGQGDLRRKILRAIGTPGKRFDEDALRLLRLFRFAAQLDFSIEDATFSAVAPRRSNLQAVSRERIREELNKAMTAPHPERAMGPLQDLGFLQDLFYPLPVRPLSPEALHRLAGVPTDLRWSWWLTLAAGTNRLTWDQALRTLTFSNSDRDSILGPPTAWDFRNRPEPTGMTVKSLVDAWGTRSRIAPGIEYLETMEREGLWTDLDWKTELQRLANSSEPIFVSELEITGRDLIQQGFVPGPDLGRMLKTLQKEVWANPNLNSREALLLRAQTLR